MTIPSTAWPRPQLLEIYHAAIEQGVIRVSPMGGEENYKAFAAAFYRIRRKGDTFYELFVEPSFHLVSLTWEAELDAALVIYNRLPDGMELPGIKAVPAQEAAGHIAQRRTQLLPPPVAAREEAEDASENFDSAAHVQELLARVQKRVEQSGNEEIE